MRFLEVRVLTIALGLGTIGCEGTSGIGGRRTGLCMMWAVLWVIWAGL